MSDEQKRILIVEDEKPLADALDKKLQQEGFKTAIAYDGKECLELLESTEFDIVLLDILMPVLDGYQVLEELQNKPNRPIVFVISNLSQADDESRVLSLGVRKYFIKSETPLSMIVEEIKKA